MFNQLTLWDTPSATSSLASVDGLSLPVSPPGRKTASSGPRPARASRSRSPAKGPELLMRGTYGPTFSASPVPAGPLASWENRLRQRLARIGSSECDLTWKASAMSDGELLSRLVPSTPRTVEIDSGLLLDAAHWATPCARDWKSESASPEFDQERMAHPRGKTLPTQVLWTAMWPTPCVPNGGRSPKGGMSITGVTAEGVKRQVDLQEACRQVVSALWPTTTAVDGARGLTTRPQDTGIPLPQRVGQVLGLTPAGSSDTTAKRGVLNPAFPCWLMGYPLAHLSCGAMAMQSFRKSQPKSSARGLTNSPSLEGATP